MSRLLLTAFLLADSLYAQETRGTIAGSVRDRPKYGHPQYAEAHSGGRPDAILMGKGEA